MQVDSGGIKLNVELHGPEEGKPVLLLHGFPDTGRVWSRQIAPLTEAGFRLIIPDQRGYGRSDKPSDIEAYKIAALAADPVAILDRLGLEKAAVVGHDWGANVAWSMATFAPQRLDRLAVLSVGHPSVRRPGNILERQRTWYMLLFQFEEIAERWLSGNEWTNFRNLFRHPDADAVIAELQASGSLTPAINWYRANVHPRVLVEPPPELPKITVPTMGMWGSADFNAGDERMAGSHEFVAAPWRYERLDGPGHWLQWEAPDEVNRLLLDFLTS
ncbi:alpha/beta fold hydrolase [Amycolatopsis sp. lyj-109]|uniref:alpha/beta fold hydrolase n=1 Tax=Amycolatopsis sp. lyj-109 TaxID=2789287 RepID=UPI00397A08F5